MKRVVIVGGSGVFGRRLAEGLHASTSSYIILAGRSLERAQRAATDLGTPEAIALDRDTATADVLRALRADLIIDAAGPFQGADLRFTRAVIEAGANYIDLADARDFVAAFPSLDALARQHGVAAITGASSTPALTHAVLDQLRAGWRRLDIVRTGIAPANKMDRGPAVMKAILGWVGAPVRVFEDGAWRERVGWSDCGVFEVPKLGRRRFALTEVPDLDLIPARYAPRDTALFMAGLELPLMQRAMQFVAALRRWRIIPNPVRLADLLRRAGNLLLPFGTDRGGMIVEALGRDAEDRPVFARWSMFAPNGQGPYTPTFAALLMAQRFIAGDPPPPGARPCVGMLTLDEFEPAFARHGFTTQIDVTPLQAPFETALGATFDNAAPAVRAAHRAGPVTRLRGEARVQGAISPLAWLAARLFGMPRSAERIPVRVTMRLDPNKETWTRRFGDRLMESRLRAVAPGIVRESFGPFGFDMQLSVAGGVLSMTIIGWRIGPIPLPAFLAPRSTATESADEQGRFRFDVPIALPLIGRLTHYSGWLALEEVEAAPAPSERETA
ncbi:SDR family oxidoreductase [Terricaulis silvestris]|uniref:Saccharopine dehydrogenase n=1 Tax=Terricaulis silvestris TaxID=2686094 RepID=A0A6I6MKF4_9CAUL|nr:SDR family oxidoreductase [Terricaulis silvestris]QGZ93444.1 Saccharopine dehydrogenase [Terricaulis silvestris]